jgi:hypothetical protein
MTPDTRRKLILGGIIAVLAAWVVIPQVLRRVGPAAAQAAAARLKLGTTTEEPATGDPGAPGDDTVSAVLAAVAALPAADTPAHLVWPADPFQRPEPAAPEQRSDAREPAADTHAGLTLNGIIGGSSPRALIRGQIVGIGDQLAGGYTVTAIDTNSVTLAGPQGPWTLTLAQ